MRPRKVERRAGGQGDPDPEDLAAGGPPIAFGVRTGDVRRQCGDDQHDPKDRRAELRCPSKEAHQTAHRLVAGWAASGLRGESACFDHRPMSPFTMK
jgi:hypothetical protein